MIKYYVIVVLDSPYAVCELSGGMKLDLGTNRSPFNDLFINKGLLENPIFFDVLRPSLAHRTSLPFVRLRALCARHVPLGRSQRTPRVVLSPKSLSGRAKRRTGSPPRQDGPRHRPVPCARFEKGMQRFSIPSNRYPLLQHTPGLPLLEGGVY